MIGPGGAGKSTLGAMLAERLRLPLIDLDEAFLARFASIGGYIGKHGYLSYARENVELYCDLSGRAESGGVVVLSSGFMCYPEETHPRYGPARKLIEHHPMTVMLIPSFEMEECVRMTVSRQCAKPYLATCAEKEESVIRSRFPAFMDLSCHKLETRCAPQECMLRILAMWGMDTR